MPMVSYCAVRHSVYWGIGVLASHLSAQVVKPASVLELTARLMEAIYK
jgi:hypothetical protein